MTAYTNIPDVDINPDKPIKSETGYALRDNPLAIAEGDPTAPSINPAALLIGGKGVDGILNNAATLTGVGFFEFTSMTVTADKSLPSCAIIRVAGNCNLSAVLRSVRSLNTTTNDQEAIDASDLLGAFVPTTAAILNEGGAGVCGSGGKAAAHGTIRTPTATSRFWAQRRPYLGGNGNLTSGGNAGFEWGPGGGCVMLIIEGNLDATGGTIDVSGQDTNDFGGGGNQPGGGGGGLLLVIATGSITNGTYKSDGGNANEGGFGNGGGGGGGFIQLVAASFVGTQTFSVAGGTSNGGGNWPGVAGQSNSATLTRDQIRTLLQRM